MLNIFKAIESEGFTEYTLKAIDKFSNEIENGYTNISRFTLQEHAGICKGGEVLIGASVVASYATRGLATSSNAGSGQDSPTSWQIDERQEHLIELWAKASHRWIENSEQILTEHIGAKIAQGAESKVYYREGDTSVIKERVSIYSTTQKALDAIIIHNYLFPETAMRVIAFTRDSDGLFRIILTQPYIRCQRLATKDEIDTLITAKGFQIDLSNPIESYISDRIILEDMHPANVFIDEITNKAICIDCIAKFK